MSPTLHESALEYAADAAASARGITPLETLLVRAFMAGAGAAARSSQTRAELHAQCLDFGRTIGSAVERAN